jgi:hypothetical protein
MSEQRYSFSDENDQFFVEIKTQKNMWLILAILLYAGLKTPHRIYRFTEIIQKEHLLADLDSPMVALVVFIGLLILFSTLLTIVWLAWSLFGKEVVLIDKSRNQLLTHYWLGKAWFTKTYRLNQMKDLKVDVIRNPVESIYKGGNIRFEYEGKTRRFGWTLIKEDAEDICDELQRYLPEQVIQLIR